MQDVAVDRGRKKIKIKRISSTTRASRTATTKNGRKKLKRRRFYFTQYYNYRERESEHRAQSR